MKKLLVVLMVLAMAPLANAALVIEAYRDAGQGTTEEITVAPSDFVIIDVYAPASISQGSFYLGVVLGGEELGHLDISTAVLEYDGLPTSLVAWNDDSDVDDYFGLAFPSILMGFTDTVPPIVDPAGLLVSHIIFHCDAEGTVTLQLWSGKGDGALSDTLIIHQIPEPITMVLLGLGGLMLRRRK